MPTHDKDGTHKAEGTDTLQIEQIIITTINNEGKIDAIEQSRKRINQDDSIQNAERPVLAAWWKQAILMRTRK